MNLFSGFKKWCWIELIGFDNTKEDYGVSSFLERAGFQPDGVSLLLSWLGFVFDHDLTYERELKSGECSYVGHPYSPERKRQNWTNFELKGLISELHKKGIKVYLSFFNYASYPDDDGKIVIDKFHKEHPEVYDKDTEPPYISVNMLKRLSDGSFYEDELQKRTVEVLCDYDFDGIQIADGISSGRLTVPASLCYDDIVKQFEEETQIKIPEKNTKEYILSNCHIDFLKFLSSRWETFFKKFKTRLEENGKTAYFNNAWTSCPFDAFYRYGVDYSGIDKLHFDGCVFEDVSGSVSILASEHNGYLMTDEERRRVYYWFLSKLMLTKANLKNTEIIPLSSIHDNMEQWGVFEHMPTYMTLYIASNLNTLIYTEKGSQPIIDGAFFTLSDSLNKEDWTKIRNIWNTAYTPDIYGNSGVTLLYSDKAIQREVDAFIKSRTLPTPQILAELKYAATPVNAVVREEDIENMPSPFGVYSGAILIVNPECFDKETLEKAYSSGRDVFVISSSENVPDGFTSLVEEKNSFGPMVLSVNRKTDRKAITLENTKDYSFDKEPLDALWTHSLKHKEYLRDFWIECAYAITELTNSPSINKDIVTEYGVRRRVCKYICSQLKDENRCRLTIINDDYWYNLPTVTFDKEIKKATALTKYKGYKVATDKNSLTVFSTLRGAEIIDIEF